jgi:hypothetical protein
MGWVYAYLGAWVIGGVLLGARILVVHPEEPRTGPAAARITGLAAAGLCGFGLCGLLAEGLGLLSGPWVPGGAFAGCAIFLAGGYALLPRGLTPVSESEH